MSYRLRRRQLLGAGLGLAATFWSRTEIAAAASDKAVTVIVPFRTAPFPYDGEVPDTGQPFLDVEQAGRRGHTSARGGIYWQDQTYRDSSVLLHVPAHFDPHRPAVLVVYFHGNSADLRRTVLGDQRVVEQFDAAGINGLLVAPQLAVDALDSSAGRFWLPGAFSQFLSEAAKRFGRSAKVSSLPVIIVAYSGGYDAAAYALTVGGVSERVAGVVLLDALFGEEERFIDFIRERGRSSFFFSAFGEATAATNEQMATTLRRLKVRVESDAPDALRRGSVTILATDAAHETFVTSAWVDDPIRWILERIPL